MLLKDLLRGHREQRGLSQEELAARLEPPVSADTISNVERGRTRPYRHTLQAMCEALELDEAQRHTVWAAWQTARGPRSTDTSDTPPAERLIGRDQELEALARRLSRSDVRVLTLVGPGGVGKTYLARALMQRVAARFRDGMQFVDLSPLLEPRLVLFTLARTLGCPDTTGAGVDQVLIELLRDQERLLVLDNFEHVLDAAPDVARLLNACRGVKVLATSREPLGLAREHLHVVPALRVPTVDELNSVAAVRASPAVALFLERAQAADERLTLDDANAALLGTLCARLDGLPLALELAAARIRTLTPSMLLAHLDQRLDLLRGPRDAPERQQSLRAALSWSYDLLDGFSQRLFRRIGIFSGVFGLDAAEVVCADMSSNFLPGLLNLADKSLLVHVESRGSAAYFRMLETVRAYAVEQLRANNEYTLAADRLAQCMLEAAESAAQAMDGPEQAVWMDRLESIHDNLRAALRWFIDSGQNVEGLRLAIALQPFWRIRGHVTEGRDWFALLLTDLGPSVSPLLHAQALNGAGMLAGSHHDTVSAHALHLAALHKARSVDNVAVAASALRQLGDVAGHQGDRAAQLAYFDQALSACRAHGLRSELAWTLLDIGESAMMELDFSECESRLRESLAIFEQAGDRSGAARAYFALGQLAFGQGDEDASAAYLERSRSTFTEIHNSEWIGAVGFYLGLLHLRRADYAQAQSILLNSLDILCEVRDEHGMAQLLEGVACLEVELKHHKRARQLFATAACTRDRLQLPIDSWDQRWLDPWMNRLDARDSTGGPPLELDPAVRCALDTRSHIRD